MSSEIIQGRTDTAGGIEANPKSKIQNPKSNLTLALVCLAIFVGAVDLTIVSAVLPQIMIDLGVSLDTELNRAAWAVSGYLAAYAVSMTFMGRLSDMFGRRALYLICLAIFVVGSGLVASANSLTMLVVGRVVQAFGAGAIVPISMALAGDLFSRERRAPVLGFIAAVDTAGWMVGHLYGGVMMAAFDDWRLLFWLNLPVGIVALLLTWWALRGVRTTRAAGGFDWLGALLVGGSLAALNIGLAAGSELGQTDFYGNPQGAPPYALPLVIASGVLLAAFIFWQTRARWPLLDLKLFRDRAVAAACAINTLSGFALGVALTNVALFINTRKQLVELNNANVLREAAFDTGWLLSALTLTMAVVAVPGGWLAARRGGRVPVLLGTLLATAGFAALATWQADIGYPLMAAQLALAGVGLGLLLSPVADTVITAAEDDQHGSASALVITLRLVGMTIGISALTLWGVQRQEMLRRAGVNDPLAASDPTTFLLGILVRVVSETFVFAAAACLLGVVLALLLRGRRPLTADH